MQFKSIYIFLSIALFSFQQSYAQTSFTKVIGKVVEKSSNQPLEFATVQLIDTENKSLLTGTITDAEGGFKLETDSKNFYLEIGFVGFQTLTFTELSIINNQVDLGTIVLSADAQQLEEVVVRAEKSQTEFRLDKRVFNVGQDLSSAGASALEVLNNVPSVMVNIEGQVSLRGSTGVQILIDGKPSIMTSDGGNALGTITAEMIERVEVITNPSAKYDAEGTSGIINIVLKKEEREGLNGSVSVNTGAPHNHSVGLSLNRRANKFNLFTQLGVGYRELPRFRETINRDLVNDITISTDGEEYRNENFYNLILGTDYQINELNTITLSGYLAYEVEDQPSEFDFERTNGAGQLLDAWNRREVTEATNPKFQYEFNYKKDFEDSEDHTFIFSALGNFFGKDQSSEFETTTLSGDFNQEDQRTASDFQEAGYTFKADYTKPLANGFSMEVGAQYVIQDISNDFSVSNLINDEWVVDQNTTNLFEYNQKVLGAYAAGAFEKDAWGVKLGFRLENTDLNTLLVNTSEENNLNYTNLFPTLHTSYKLTERLSFQAGYSRRIYRPRLWDLNPFFNIRNNFNIRLGNPELLPEFTDSYEVTGIYILEAISFNFGFYQRYTTDVIERVSFIEDNISITQPVNIGTNRTNGIELNSKYEPSKWLTLNGDFNFSFFQRSGELEGTSFDFNANQWNGRMVAKLKLPLDIDFELAGNYQSSVETVQGKQSAFLFADLGLRKKMMKGKAVISLSIRDAFASRISESEAFQNNFYLYDYNLRGRFFTMGFSYGFGKGEAMEFSGSRRR